MRFKACVAFSLLGTIQRAASSAEASPISHDQGKEGFKYSGVRGGTTFGGLEKPVLPSTERSTKNYGNAATPAMLLRHNSSHPDVPSHALAPPLTFHQRRTLIGIGQWKQMGNDINGEASEDYSGYAVAMSRNGRRVIIGAPMNDGNGDESGHARVYEWNGSSWKHMGADIDGEDYRYGGERFGISVSISRNGSRVVIGAERTQLVRVFRWNGSSTLR